jgi:hypothetical protein
MGHSIDFDRITEAQARKMLTRTQALLREWRTSVSRHYSERNPDYIKLVMVEQALKQRMNEQMTAATPGMSVDPAKQAALAAAQQQQNKRNIQDQIRTKQKEISDLQRAMNSPVAMAEEYDIKDQIRALRRGTQMKSSKKKDKYLSEPIVITPKSPPPSTPAPTSTPESSKKKDKYLSEPIVITPKSPPPSTPAPTSTPESKIEEKYMGFKKTVAAIKKGGSARDPEAVAAASGLEKYGKKAFQKAAAAGKKMGESRRGLREGSELQTAQVVLASQDMIDRIQGMMEDISEMQFKDLPALTDSIKNDMGVDQASQFQSQASAALTNLLAAVQAGKTELESAQGVLTGQAPQVPGAAPADAGGMPAAPAPGGDIEADLSLDANMPATGEEPEDEAPAATLGRERR